MKRTVLFWAMLIAFKFSYAQWTTSGNNINNTNTGSVSIGTTSPESGFKLDVNGLGAIGTQSSARIYLGTTDATHAVIQARDNSVNQNLNFFASSYNFTTGNVGIGIASPAFKLDVNGSQRLNGDFTFANDQTAYLIRGPYNGGAIRIRSNSGAATDRDVQLGHVDNSGTWTSYMIVGQDGNVGIGNTAPLSLFQVDDGCTKANIGDASGSALNWGTSYLGFNAGRSGSNWTLHTDGTSNGGGVVYSSVTGDIYFAPLVSTGNTDRTLTDAQIASSINFKITPTGAYAKKVYVQTTGFPDYVFKANYRLRPLSEVKAYIEENHHLPEIPAATQVEKDGQDVGEMNKLLLKKVEELTLYLIEEHKQNTAQQKRISALERHLKKISSKEPFRSITTN